MTAKTLIKKAQSQIGVYESPPSSNNVKFNTEYYGRPVHNKSLAWCCVFIWWIFKELGASDMFFGGRKTASCTTLMNYHKAKGQFVTSGYKPGDIVLFNWRGRKTVAQHIGIVESVIGNTITSIEGNTSMANNTNGGEVMRRFRGTQLIIGAIRSPYESPIDIFKGIIQAKCKFSDPDGVFSFTDKSPWAEALYRKWAESYK